MVFLVSVSAIVLLDIVQKATGFDDYLLAHHLICNNGSDNSVFILMASTSLFLLFSRSHFQNKTVNQIAKSVFAVYIMEWFIRPFLFRYFDIANVNAYLQPVATIGCSIVILLVCVAVDQLRILATSKLENRFENVEMKLYNNTKTMIAKLLSCQ